MVLDDKAEISHTHTHTYTYAHKHAHTRTQAHALFDDVKIHYKLITASGYNCALIDPGQLTLFSRRYSEIAC